MKKNHSSDPTYDRHPLADIVEIQDGQELVASLVPHFHDGDAVGRARAEDKSKIAGRRHQRPFIGGLGLVENLP